MRRIFLTGLALVLLLSTVAAAAETVTLWNPSGVCQDGSYVDEVLRRTANDTETNQNLSSAFPKAASEEVAIQKDLWEEVNNLFYERGWTDGMFIVPPTTERVERMLQGTDLPRDFPIGVLAPMNGVATVEKIAINAVIAGCRPSHMPFLLAAVEGIAIPQFDLRGMSTTTNPDALLMILSGPDIKDLGVNVEGNVFGRGNRANLAMSRALNLILHNVGGSRPRITDMSTLGQPAEIAMFLAENIAATPWLSYHTELGFPVSTNVVTVAAAENYQGVVGSGYHSEDFMRIIANTLKGQDRTKRDSTILVLAQDTAGMLANEGWNRNSIRSYILEQAQAPLREVQALFENNLSRYRPIKQALPLDAGPGTMVPRPYLDNLYILVSGGVGEKSMVIPCWTGGHPSSNAVRLPHNWKDIIQMR